MTRFPPLPAALLVGLCLAAPVSGQARDTVSIHDLREALAAGSPYASAALREFVARAAEANRVLPELLESYRSGVESEIALLQGEADGREVVLQVEQVASELAWRADAPPVQRVVGYRSRTLGLVPSLLAMFEVPWVVPTLYGETLDLVRWSAPTVTDEGRVLRRRAAHPLGPERDRFYRFEGGDTVLVLRLPDRTIPLVRVEVVPAGLPERPTLLFRGHLDIDATRHQIVRMRGRMISADPEPSLDERVLGVAFTGATFVEFESAEYDGRFWLPRQQRIEVQAVSRLTDTRVALRLVSRFRFPEPNPDPPVALPPDVPPGGLLVVGDVSEADGFEGWSTEIGTLTGDAGVHDFRDLEPLPPPSGAGPRVRFGVRHLAHLVRYNAAEGLFTGGGLVAEGGPLPAGLRLRGHAGWAWGEGTVRGGAEVAWVPGTGGEWALRAERQLLGTADFGGGRGREPGVPPVVSGDEQAFHDHRTVGLVARLPGPGDVWWRVEVGRGADRTAGDAHPPSGLPGEDEPPLPVPLEAAVAEGDYWLGRATLERHGGATGFGVGTGTSVRLHAEGGGGDLDWARLEAGARVGRVLGPVSVDGRVDAGLTLADDPPPQRLFELGRYGGLPGYPARAFAGDRAAVVQLGVGYALPLLRRPLGGGALLLPAVAPEPAVILRSGWTGASAPGREVLQRIGGVTTDGLRSTLDLRLRLFGGGVSVGAARPLESGGEWRFVWSLVAEF